MKRPVWLLVLGVVIVLAVAIYLWHRHGKEQVVADLVAQFPNAKDKRPSADSFSIVSADLNGTKEQAVFVKVTSRLVYTVAVPDNAEFKVDLGLLPEAWTTQGDGVLFRVLVTPANGNQEEMLNLDLNPFANPSDRGWHPITIDFSEFAGETVDVFLNTNSSPPSRPPRNDTAGDLAVWGNPRVVTH